MYKKSTEAKAAIGRDSAMETRDHSKNGVSPKDQRSRGNMLQKVFLLFAVLCISIASIFAQDIITLKNGEDIKALVQEIGDVEVKYKKFDNPKGPNYILKKSEIFRITYANGSVEKFVDAQPVVSTIPANNAQNGECTLVACGLLVACKDATRKMTWEEAMLNAPKGYKLPTISQLQCMIRSLRTDGRLLASEYWTCEESGRKKAYSVTTDDYEEEKNSKDELFFVRYVKDNEYKSENNTFQKYETKPENTSNNISNNISNNNSETTNDKGFVLSKTAEIIVDNYGFIDGALASNIIVKQFEELGFCCVHREEFDKNTTATVAIAIRNKVFGVSYEVIDRKQNIVVFEDTYSKFKAKMKDKIVGLPYFMKSIMSFVVE